MQQIREAQARQQQLQRDLDEARRAATTTDAANRLNQIDGRLRQDRVLLDDHTRGIRVTNKEVALLRTEHDQRIEAVSVAATQRANATDQTIKELRNQQAELERKLEKLKKSTDKDHGVIDQLVDEQVNAAERVNNGFSALNRVVAAMKATPARP